MGYWEDASKLSEIYNKKLQAEEKVAFNQLTLKWNVIYKELEEKIAELSKLEFKTVDQLYRLEKYKLFLVEAQKQIIKYSKFSDALLQQEQGIFIQLGLESTKEMIGLVNVNFQKLNYDAISHMVGNSFEGGRLYDLLIKSYPETINRITNTLIKSVALGINPRQTARLLRVDMAGNLSRALRIARTETMMAYRESGRLQMIQSKIVDEWERIEQNDACEFCKERNGKRYSLDTVFETHPNCRGTSIPIVKLV
jgi:SPP1 gp7 family putative phage head morphogenesis protein